MIQVIPVVQRELLSALAIALTLVGFVPYIVSILRGSTRPHVFSWIIWGTTTVLVFFAQLAGRGGVGAWPIGVSGLITLSVAVLAWLRRGDITITTADWGFLFAALGTLPLWYVTADPFWAVLVLTVVDLLGFGPTLRKVLDAPHSESALFYLVFAVRNLLVLLALEYHSWTTVLFPVAVGMACLVLIWVMLVRRAVLRQGW